MNTIVTFVAALQLTSLPKPSLNSATPIDTILNTVFVLLGTVSLIVIILSGIRFISSRGDPQAVARARDTIIYAAIGLAIAVLAGTILNFIIGNIA